MMVISINPGSGPVANSTESNAIENMKQFVIDCGFRGISFNRVPDADYGEGRYAFRVWRDGYSIEHEIQMPGLPLAQVRYMGEDGQNIWDFPRLYVDDSSWVWAYALLNDADAWEGEQDD